MCTTFFFLVSIFNFYYWEGMWNENNSVYYSPQKIPGYACYAFSESKFNLDALSIHFLFHLLYCKVTFLFSLRYREISYVSRGNIIYKNTNRPTLEDLDLMPTTIRLCLSTFVSFKIQKSSKIQWLKFERKTLYM